MTKDEFQKLVQQGPVILDGATGSNLRAMGMPVGVSSEVWVMEHPEVITKLQRDYQSAGSQIIYAPTFQANRICMKGHGKADQVPELNHRLVEISRTALGENFLIGGDLSTVGQMLEPMGYLSYEEVYAAYQEQIALLAEAGVDLLVAETMMSEDETVACLDAALSVTELPFLCSFSVQADGSLLYGGSVYDAAQTLEGMGASAVGINCSCGPDQLVSVIAHLRELVEIPIIAKPNAGLPEIDDLGQAHYSMGPDAFAEHMKALVDAGASLVGGCCGTTPEYIRKLCEAIR